MNAHALTRNFNKGIQSETPEIGLLLGSDFSFSLPMANILVPELKKNGVRPILLFPKHKTIPVDAPKILHDYAFFDRTLLQNYVYPFLNQPASKRPKGTNGSAEDHEVLITVQQLANKFDIEIHDVPNVNDPEFIDSLINMPHLKQLCNIRGMQIYKPVFLEAVAQAGIYITNLHPGKLPEYKGVMPPMRAMHAKFNAVGDDHINRIMNVATLHEIDRGIDTGNIIGHAAAPLDLKTSVFENYTALVPEAAYLVSQLVPRIRLDLSTSPQNPDKGNYYTYPTEKELASYKKIGLNILPTPERLINLYAQAFARPGSPADVALRAIIRDALIENKTVANDFISPAAGFTGVDRRHPHPQPA